MSVLRSLLLCTARLGVLVTPLLALVCGGPFDPFPLTYFPDIVLKNVLFRILVEVALGAWLVLACMEPRYRPRWRGSLLALTCFVAVIAVADTFGVNPQQSIWSNYERMQGLVGHLHLLAFFVVAIAVLDSERWWLIFFRTSLVVAAIVSVFAICQYLHNYHMFEIFPKDLRWLYRMHNQKEFAGVNFRADARLGSPVYLAVYALFHIFLAVLLLFRATRLRTRVLYLGAVLLYGFTLFVTGTRSAMYGVFAGMALALVLLGIADKRRPVRVLAIASMAVLLLVAASPFVALALDPFLAHDDPFLQRFSHLWDALGARTMVWRTALTGFAEHPLLGWGQENFQYVFDKHYDPGLVFYDQWYDHPHNVFIGWLVAAGVPGLVAYAWLLATPFWAMWRRPSALTLADRTLLSGLLAGYVVFNMWMFDNLISHVLFLSVVGFAHRQAVPGAAAAPRSAAAAAGAAVAAGAAAARGLSPGRLAAVAAVVVAALPAAVYHVNVQPLRAAIALSEAANNPRVVRNGVPGLRIEDVVQMETFAKREVAEQAARLAMELISNQKVEPEFKRRAVETALAALHAEEQYGRVRTQVYLGMVLRALKRYPEAAAHFDRARTMAPNRQLLLVELGRTYLMYHRDEEAMHCFRAALELEPEFLQPAVLLGATAAEYGHEAVLQEMLGVLHPLDEPPREPDDTFAEALFVNKRYDLLISIYERLVELSERIMSEHRQEWMVGPLIDRYIALSVPLAAAGRLDEALALVRKAIAADPTFRELGWKIMEQLRAGTRLTYPKDGWRPPQPKPTEASALWRAAGIVGASLAGLLAVVLLLRWLGRRSTSAGAVGRHA